VEHVPVENNPVETILRSREAEAANSTVIADQIWKPIDHRIAMNNIEPQEAELAWIA